MIDKLDQVIELYDLKIFVPKRSTDGSTLHFSELPNVEIWDLDRSKLVGIMWVQTKPRLEAELFSTPTVKSLDFEAFIERERVRLVESLPEDERWPIYFELASKRKLHKEGYSVVPTETRLSDGRGVVIFESSTMPHRRYTVIVEDYKFVRVV